MATSETPKDPIDQKVLDRIRELDVEGESQILERVVNLYLNQANENVRDLLAALKSSDMGTAKDMAHGLKSSSANLGALEFSKLCADIEGALRAGNDLPPATAEEVERQYGRVKAALIAEIS